jgi:hypothetical protein
MVNPRLLAKGVNGEIYEMPEDLRERLVVSPDQLYELREAAHRHREALSEKVTLGGPAQR